MINPRFATKLGCDVNDQTAIRLVCEGGDCTLDLDAAVDIDGSHLGSRRAQICSRCFFSDMRFPPFAAKVFNVSVCRQRTFAWRDGVTILVREDRR
jgi:hypothetical protein